MTYKQSPSQTVGPFFHYGLIREKDQNILVNEHTKGQFILIKGVVYDGENNPITDAMLEIWQADGNGYHNHPADPNQAKADTEFKGFGRADTVEAGQYFFKTVKPGRVQGQAPHISVRVFARGMLIHAYTRLYFSDETSANEEDTALNAVETERQSTLIAIKQESGDLPTYRFDIHLQGDNETVFFNP